MFIDVSSAGGSTSDTVYAGGLTAVEYAHAHYRLTAPLFGAGFTSLGYPGVDTSTTAGLSFVITRSSDGAGRPLRIIAEGR